MLGVGRGAAASPRSAQPVDPGRWSVDTRSSIAVINPSCCLGEVPRLRCLLPQLAAQLAPTWRTPAACDRGRPRRARSSSGPGLSRPCTPVGVPWARLLARAVAGATSDPGGAGIAVPDDWQMLSICSGNRYMISLREHRVSYMMLTSQDRKFGVE